MRPMKMKRYNRNNRDSTGYNTKGLMLENIPDKPGNYIENLDLRIALEDIVSTIGYDLRKAAPGHSIGHFTHPDWGYRLYNQYKIKGQALALLNQVLGMMNIHRKKVSSKEHLENSIRGARKGSVYKQILFEYIGKDKFMKLHESLRKEQPELFDIESVEKNN